jgi:hypothetical protein
MEGIALNECVVLAWQFALRHETSRDQRERHCWRAQHAGLKSQGILIADIVAARPPAIQMPGTPFYLRIESGYQERGIIGECIVCGDEPQW